MKKILLLLTGIIVGGVLVLGASSGLANWVSHNKQNIVVGAKAPDFSLLDLSGHTFQLSQMRGKPVLINFFATYCEPCRDEMPLIQSTAQRYPNDLIVTAIDFQEPESQVRFFAGDFLLTFRVLLDTNGKVAESYQVQAFPMSYFIDSNGVVQAIQVGGLTQETLNQYLRKIGVVQ
jgi:cytochrome c biogenesis protein CcmG, thiol:disulfide interchange protein DsbE